MFGGAVITRNMEVVGTDSQRIGRVRAVGPRHLLVDSTRQRGLQVPFGAIQRLTEDRLVLAVPAAEADRQGWS